MKPSKPVRPQIATWWEYDWTRKIVPVAVCAFTAKTVTIIKSGIFSDHEFERRCDRFSQYARFFPSFEECREYEESRLIEKIGDLKLKLLFYEEDLESIKSQQEPKEEGKP